MSTKKVEFSLRLRHDEDNLLMVTQQLGLVAHAGWDKGEQNRTLRGLLQEGSRASSYRSFALDAVNDTELEDAIFECVEKLTPFASLLNSFVSSGGMASLAVAWFCDSAVGGGRIPAEAIKKMAEINLTLDVYIYSAVESNLNEVRGRPYLT